MQKQIAYLLGATIDAKQIEAMEAGNLPRTEVYVFRQRNHLPILCYDDIQAANRALFRWFTRKDQRHWALSWMALDQRKNYSGLLTSGDDVGLPMVMQTWARRVSLPVYNIQHGSFFGSKKFRLLMKVMGRMRNVHYLCLSDSLRRIMIEEFCVPPPQAHNTGYGVDTHFFRPSRSLDSPPTIASAGTANRDYKTLVAAVRPLGVDLKIAADSAWFPSSLDIDRVRLPANIEARSYGDYIGLRNLYARSTFVVVPLYPARHACGFAVIAEAQAMGKAVVTTKIEGRSDFVVEGETGFYVEPGDAEGLREKIELLLDDPALARKMGQCARARMEEQFSLEAYCEKIERVLGINRGDG